KVDMARSLDPLVVGKVVGDVLDMFVPVAELTVHYGSKQIANGCEIKPSAAADRPRVQINRPRAFADFYTLVCLHMHVMVDPDAPSPSEPTLREWLHWMVVDIPEGSDASRGKEAMPYMGPQPPTGIHRYVFALFKQRGVMGVANQAPESRSNFNTRQFAADNGLGLPVAAVYFNSQKEATNKRR
ncbi:hypothetical protein RJ640_017620, partial [Escallonia rubra]